MRFNLCGLTEGGPTVIKYVQSSVFCAEKDAMPTVLDNFESNIAVGNTGNTAITDNCILHIADNKNRKSACVGVIVKEYDR